MTSGLQTCTPTTSIRWVVRRRPGMPMERVLQQSVMIRDPIARLTRWEWRDVPEAWEAPDGTISDNPAAFAEATTKSVSYLCSRCQATHVSTVPDLRTCGRPDPNSSTGICGGTLVVAVKTDPGRGTVDPTAIGGYLGKDFSKDIEAAKGAREWRHYVCQKCGSCHASTETMRSCPTRTAPGAICGGPLALGTPEDGERIRTALLLAGKPVDPDVTDLLRQLFYWRLPDGSKLDDYLAETVNQSGDMALFELTKKIHEHLKAHP